jgi:hypothetical protein
LLLEEPLRSLCLWKNHLYGGVQGCTSLLLVGIMDTDSLISEAHTFAPYPLSCRSAPGQRIGEMKDKKKIIELNDAFRKFGDGNGKIFFTQKVQVLPLSKLKELVRKMIAFDDFNADNDPYGEHDFGVIYEDGIKYFWIIDYYDLSIMDFHEIKCT